MCSLVLFLEKEVIRVCCVSHILKLTLYCKDFPVQDHYFSARNNKIIYVNLKENFRNRLHNNHVKHYSNLMELKNYEYFFILNETLVFPVKAKRIDYRCCPRLRPRTVKKMLFSVVQL